MNWISLSYKNIYRNKRRSILTIISIGVVAFVMSFQDGVINGMQDDLIRNIKDLKTGDLFIQNKDLEKYQLFNPMSLLTDSRDIKPLLEKYPDITIIENIDFGVTVYNKKEEMNFAKAMAFSMDAQKDKLSKGISIFKLYENQGTLPMGEGEVAVTLNLAQKNNIQVGDRISLLSQTVGRSLNGASYTVSGIIYFTMPAYNGDTIIFDIPAAKKILKTDSVTRILVETHSDKLAETIIADITPKLEENYVVKGWADSQDATIIKLQKKIMTIVNLIFFVIGGSIIINTSMMNILERRREIGMMSSLGTKVKEIRFLFFLESVWLGFLGTVLGLLLGGILVTIIGQGGWDMMGDAMSKETGLAISSRIFPRVSLEGMLTIFSFGMIISSIISYIPTGRVAKISPAEAFRS